jgi:uncharacterized protein RhaS with RHS repeats
MDGAKTSYAYDPAGRMTSVLEGAAGSGGAMASFGYDGLGRKLSGTGRYAQATTYGYDAVSRLTALNQYTLAGGASFAYDANGNLTNDGSSAFLYDVENRLVSASGARTAALRYDPLGRLYETTGTSGTTRFLHDGDALVAEYDGAGALLRRYVHGSSIDDPVLRRRATSAGSSPPARRGSPNTLQHLDPSYHYVRTDAALAVDRNARAATLPAD